MPKITKEADPPRTAAEDRFLAECFLAFDMELRKIDMSAVASAMGYSNETSADNKWALLKRKLNLNIGAFHRSTNKRVGADEPATPKKATPQRVTRKRAATMPQEHESSAEDSDKTA